MNFKTSTFLAVFIGSILLGGIAIYPFGFFEFMVLVDISLFFSIFAGIMDGGETS